MTSAVFLFLPLLFLYYIPLYKLFSMDPYFYMCNFLIYEVTQDYAASLASLYQMYTQCIFYLMMCFE